MKQYIAIGLAILAGFFGLTQWIDARSLRSDLGNVAAERDSALIVAGKAERQIGDWRGRFGVLARQLQAEGTLKETLRNENKELRERATVTVTVRDTIRLPADTVAAGGERLRFPGNSGGLVFTAWVDTRLRELSLDWRLDLALDVTVTEEPGGRRDIFVRTPDHSNALLSVRRFDYVPRRAGFWESISVGPLAGAGSGGATLGGLGCFKAWCVGYDLLDQEVVASYQWSPFANR